MRPADVANGFLLCVRTKSGVGRGKGMPGNGGDKVALLRVKELSQYTILPKHRRWPLAIFS